MFRVLVFYVCDILYVCRYVISALSVMCLHLIGINYLSIIPEDGLRDAKCMSTTASQ